MDKNGGGVKVTYIETQFVTSDAAGFKDLVQRLTGRAVVVAPAPAQAAPLHRPRPRNAADGSQGYSYTAPATGGTRPAGFNGGACHLEELNEMADFSDLFYFGGIDERRRPGPHNGGYNDFPY